MFRGAASLRENLSPFGQPCHSRLTCEDVLRFFGVAARTRRFCGEVTSDVIKRNRKASASNTGSEENSIKMYDKKEASCGSRPTNQ